MFSSLASNIVFNEIDYFTYLNLWLVSLFFFLLFFFLAISSSLLFLSSLSGSDTLMEFLLTIFSIFFILLIISPSLIILLDSDLIILPSFIIYSLCYQWAWTFNLYSSISSSLFEFIGFSIDHYIISSYSSNSLLFSDFFPFFLFDINSFLIFPVWSSIKILVFSFDVIHSLGFYSFGSKIDAIPGRINLAFTLRFLGKGEHRGFCFELCGKGHSSMLMVVLGLGLL